MMLPRATLTMTALGFIAANSAAPNMWWLASSPLVQIATASEIASASCRRSRGNTCSTTPSLSAVRDTAIGRALMALSLRASSRPIGPRPITHTTASSMEVTFLVISARSQSCSRWQAIVPGSPRNKASNSSNACSDTLPARTPAALVTMRPAGMPMARPLSIPAETKCIQRNAWPSRRRISPIAGLQVRLLVT